MAGAAAKKAAAARISTKKFYRPFLLTVNGIFVALRIWRVGFLPNGWPEFLVWAVLGAIQYHCYAGILDQAANSAAKMDDGKLVGGTYLDILAVALVIQYIGGLLWRPIYWLCLLFPAWGGYSLYTTFYGGGVDSKKSKSVSTPASPGDDDDGDATASRNRQKRVDRRQDRRQIRKTK